MEIESPWIQRFSPNVMRDLARRFREHKIAKYPDNANEWLALIVRGII